MSGVTEVSLLFSAARFAGGAAPLAKVLAGRLFPAASVSFRFVNFTGVGLFMACSRVPATLIQRDIELLAANL